MTKVLALDIFVFHIQSCSSNNPNKQSACNEEALSSNTKLGLKLSLSPLVPLKVGYNATLLAPLGRSICAILTYLLTSYNFTPLPSAGPRNQILPPPPYQNQSINRPICTLINRFVLVQARTFPMTPPIPLVGGGGFHRGRNVWFK
jgi:hypothetical protein